MRFHFPHKEKGNQLGAGHVNRLGAAARMASVLMPGSNAHGISTSLGRAVIPLGSGGGGVDVFTPLLTETLIPGGMATATIDDTEVRVVDPYYLNFGLTGEVFFAIENPDDYTDADNLTQYLLIGSQGLRRLATAAVSIAANTSGLVTIQRGNQITSAPESSGVTVAVGFTWMASGSAIAVDTELIVTYFGRHIGWIIDGVGCGV